MIENVTITILRWALYISFPFLLASECTDYCTAYKGTCVASGECDVDYNRVMCRCGQGVCCVSNEAMCKLHGGVCSTEEWCTSEGRSLCSSTGNCNERGDKCCMPIPTGGDNVYHSPGDYGGEVDCDSLHGHGHGHGHSGGNPHAGYGHGGGNPHARHGGH